MLTDIDRLPLRGSHVLSEEDDRTRRHPSIRRIIVGLLLTAIVLAAAVALNDRRDDPERSPRDTPGSNYLVRTGDTTSSVAYLHGLSTDRLLKANDLTLSDSIEPGSRLTIPDLPTDRRQPPSELLADEAKLGYEPFFDTTTRRYDLPPGLLGALAWHQSEWVNALVSDDERMGMGQLRPEILDFLRREIVDEALDPRLPEDNLSLTGAYLDHLLTVSEGDRAGALAGYYLGLETAAPGTWDLDVVEFVRDVLLSAPNFAVAVAPVPPTTSGSTTTTS